MAVPVPKGKNKSFEDLTRAQQTAVRLFADGKGMALVAKMMAPAIFPVDHERDPAYARRLMRKKLRRWEESQWFRDMVYQTTMQGLDADIPQIMRGMSKRARKRVDAARLVLEVTGRHNPRGEQAAPAAIHISFGGAVPRPQNRPQIEDPDLVEIEPEAEEDLD